MLHCIARAGALNDRRYFIGLNNEFVKNLITARGSERVRGWGEGVRKNFIEKGRDITLYSSCNACVFARIALHIFFSRRCIVLTRNRSIKFDLNIYDFFFFFHFGIFSKTVESLMFNDKCSTRKVKFAVYLFK